MDSYQSESEQFIEFPCVVYGTDLFAILTIGQGLYDKGCFMWLLNVRQCEHAFGNTI